MAVAIATRAYAQSEPIANPDFDRGAHSPEGWTLASQGGRWVDRRFLEVTGSGSDSSFWKSDCRFTPGQLYYFRFHARRVDGAGPAIAGPTFANRDYYSLSNDWAWYGCVFRVPDGVASSPVRLGQWHATGAILFNAVRLGRVLPVYRSVDRLRLGEGESIRDGQYTFKGSFAHPGSNFHRTLQSATAGFNSDRWCFSGNDQITYAFELPGHRFLSGEVGLNVNHFDRGGCVAEVSRDRDRWQTVATKDGLGSIQTGIPSALLPAERIFLRIRGSQPHTSLQVNSVEFQAVLDGPAAQGSGKTDFADVEQCSPDVAIQEITLCDDQQPGSARLQVVARNVSGKKARISLTASIMSEKQFSPPANPQMAEFNPGQAKSFVVKIPVEKPGVCPVALTLRPDEGQPVTVKLSFTMPDYYRADYGEQIEGVAGKPTVWWCDATHKIPRSRRPPNARGLAARLQAARNDREAVQIVVRPQQPLEGLTASVTPLSGPDGAVIAARQVRILRVYYHFVDHPTDATGLRDDWPDALPPLAGPIDVPAGQNQPLWVLVHVPKDARAGDYAGSVHLNASEWSAEIPVRLHVWDFTLPDQNHLETGFGLSSGMVFRYHQLKTEADKRRVWEMYLRSFAEHRISPYDPAPLDPIRVKFFPGADPPRAELDFTTFDREMARVIETYHFTNFRLPLEAMGSGTYESRQAPRIGKYGDATPQYQVAFASYVKQLQEHLRRKGWLRMAYVYWFDEPQPRDYEFVRNGMMRLKRAAPELQRMLTERPGAATLNGAVDIWCPITPNYDHTKAQRRRAEGERFWWYVCCGPKAPFCTLFIDHPATDLRIWLWQTWQRGIVGNLVWESNYWTSSNAYPDRPQNPYADPMGYVSSESLPRGTRQYWGNGDGRFVYPPLSAAVPGASGTGPVIEPPVSSIRWEMLREGIEDYEYLYLLRERLAARRGMLSPQRAGQLESLLEVPVAITSSMTTSTTDPAPIYERRAAVARAIEELK
jgi:hypothetical protein